MIKQIQNFNRKASSFEEYSQLQLDVIQRQAKTTKLDDWLTDHPKLLNILIAILEVVQYFAWIKRGGKVAVALLLAAARALQERNK
jgi:hypothetical protein